MLGGLDMGDYVSENTCGTCEYYEYKGQNEKGYCNRMSRERKEPVFTRTSRHHGLASLSS